MKPSNGFLSSKQSYHPNKQNRTYFNQMGINQNCKKWIFMKPFWIKYTPKEWNLLKGFLASSCDAKTPAAYHSSYPIFSLLLSDSLSLCLSLCLSNGSFALYSEIWHCTVWWLINCKRKTDTDQKVPRNIKIYSYFPKFWFIFSNYIKIVLCIWVCVINVYMCIQI